MTIQAQKFLNVLSKNAARPDVVIIAQDPAFRSDGYLEEDAFGPTAHGVIKVKALVSVTSWIEVTWTEPTTVVGVQFFGDERGSWARIKVDGEKVWEDNTNGQGSTFSDYIQISGLANEPHTVRVEALGQPGIGGGPIFVGVAGFGSGEVSEENKIGDGSDIYMPIVMGGNSG